ncbi:MAG: alkaline phosphatase D family protein [Microthrixaceae bacterium]|nr:alkaline phosphatase D family protein [Microthrixaceae bacterium]MCO5312574.1 alkaline phosphatase D family protein [Microthrixaceae bacterium]HPB44927.1 alkaline phosphatase D family protein [Microthrixaceae bacterium]
MADNDPISAHRIDRRSFLSGVGAAAVTVAVASCSSGDGASTGGSGGGSGGASTSTSESPEVAAVPAPSAIGLPAGVFSLGVASGDPTDTSVMLWTRLVADPLAAATAMGERDLEVAYDVALDEGFERLVASGLASAPARLAHSVHLDVTGLDPGSWYHYRFRIGDQTSSTGRTRTMPAPGAAGVTPGGAAAEQFRFVVASCQDYQWGHYAAWRRAVETPDLDAVLFLGDYIYEYSVGDRSPGETGERVWANEETHSLEQYRVRYGQVRSDPALIAAHEAVPWQITFDDHEVSNNYAGDVGQDDVDQPLSRDRRLAGYQAWYEHMPVRLDGVPESFESLRVHQALRFGDLVTLYAIETRQHADPAPCRVEMPEGTPPLLYSDDRPSCEQRFDPERTNLGAAQEAWLLDELAASDTTWNVLANPIMFSGMNLATREAPEYTLDTWDGYVASRARVLGALAEVSNPVIVTGDWHASFVLDVRPELIAEADDPAAVLPDGPPSSPPAMTEFVFTAISSVIFAQDYRAANDHIRYFEARNGYGVVTVTPEQLGCEFVYVDDVWDPDSPATTVDRWAVDAGSPQARRVG